jgi:hypothetical protein
MLALACAAAATLLRLDSGPLGYAIDASDIQDALGGRIETAHFTIYYAKVPSIESEIELIARDHEFRYAQVVAQLGVAPAGKLRSYYFADHDQKARLFGARRVEMAKPWRHEIYIDHQGFPHDSLRHELGHAVASEFGDSWFGVSAHRLLGMPLLFSPGLIEGLAVAIDWPAGDRLTPHEAVRVLIAMGVKPSLHELMGVRFFAVASSRGYITAGSFVRFLLDTFGAQALRRVYHDGDFEGVYGASLTELESAWLAKIATIDLPPGTVEASRERYRGTTVFARPCPHAIAARQASARTAAARGDHDEAIALLREVCGDAPDEPQHQLDLAGALQAGETGDRAEGEVIWTRLAHDADRVTSSLRGRAYRRLAVAAGNRGELARVRALLDEANTLAVEGEDRRQLDAMRFALDYQGPAGDALRNYFWGSARRLESAEQAVAAEPASGFAHYLLGLQKVVAGDRAAAAAELDRALGLDLPGAAFVRNAARELAIAAYRTNDYARLSRAIAVLSQLAPVDRALAEDWQARLIFDTTGAVPTSR